VNKPTTILSPGILAHWKFMAMERKNHNWAGAWADRRLIQVINSHEVLRDRLKGGTDG
jgi:hypothetical protein